MADIPEGAVANNEELIDVDIIYIYFFFGGGGGAHTVLPVSLKLVHSSLAPCIDTTFQEISWNQEISDRKKELQEKLNSVSR